MEVHPLPDRKSSPIAGGRTRDMRPWLSIILLAMLQCWSAAAADATISIRTAFYILTQTGDRFVISRHCLIERRGGDVEISQKTIL